MFGKSPVCPVSCTVHEQENCSGDPFTDLAFSGEGPWTLTAPVSEIQGYSYNLCLSCSDDQSSKNIEDWKVIQCGKLSPGTFEDRHLVYEDGADDELIVIEANELFANSPICPITGCIASDAGRCDEEILTA